MWSSADVIGLFSNNVVSFSHNVVLRGPLFSLNSVSKLRRGDHTKRNIKYASALPRIVRPKENALEFDYSAFYGKTGNGKTNCIVMEVEHYF